MANASIYAVFIVFAVALIIIAALYISNTTPFSSVYLYQDPRKAFAPQPANSWLTPVAQYSPLNRDTPDPQIACVYCAANLDPSRCIANQTTHSATPNTRTCT